MIVKVMMIWNQKMELEFQKLQIKKNNLSKKKNYKVMIWIMVTKKWIWRLD